MNQDYKDLLSAFHAHGVKYLVVGGYAVILHAQPRFTKDIDFFVRPDSANARATYAALAEFGAALQGIRPEDFTDRKSFFRFGRDPRWSQLIKTSGFPGDMTVMHLHRATAPGSGTFRSARLCADNSEHPTSPGPIR